MLFYQLAGRHAEVLEELCNKLSEALAAGGSTGTTGGAGAAGGAGAGAGAELAYWQATSVEYYERCAPYLEPYLAPI